MGIPIIYIAYGMEYTAEVTKVYEDGYCDISNFKYKPVHSVYIKLCNDIGDWKWPTNQEPKEIEWQTSYTTNTSQWNFSSDVTWESNVPILSKCLKVNIWRPVLPLIIEEAVNYKLLGLCPNCGDKGEWRSLGLVCRNGHGKFLG